MVSVDSTKLRWRLMQSQRSVTASRHYAAPAVRRYSNTPCSTRHAPTSCRTTTVLHWAPPPVGQESIAAVILGYG